MVLAGTHAPGYPQDRPLRGHHPSGIILWRRYAYNVRFRRKIVMNYEFISVLCGLMAGLAGALSVLSAGYHWIYQRCRDDVMQEIQQRNQQDIQDQLKQLVRDVSDVRRRRWWR